VILLSYFARVTEHAEVSASPSSPASTRARGRAVGAVRRKPERGCGRRTKAANADGHDPTQDQAEKRDRRQTLSAAPAPLNPSRRWASHVPEGIGAEQIGKKGWT